MFYGIFHAFPYVCYYFMVQKCTHHLSESLKFCMLIHNTQVVFRSLWRGHYACIIHTGNFVAVVYTDKYKDCGVPKTLLTFITGTHNKSMSHIY